jgi:hypothetical protein
VHNAIPLLGTGHLGSHLKLSYPKRYSIASHNFKRGGDLDFSEPLIIHAHLKLVSIILANLGRVNSKLPSVCCRNTGHYQSPK